MYKNTHKSIRNIKITLGVCYYPEYWPRELWEPDITRMLEHGIEVVRISEFAWSTFEPREGQYEFELFDSFLDLAHKYGMKVIMCTTGATPPAWLTHAYPEVLNATVEGILYRHGQRRHCNYNSAVYRKYLAAITEKLAERYCKHPAVIGWQVDNEMNCETDVFYSESDHAAFRKFLQNNYGTLDRLNEAWGTNFWSQTYTEWEQVHLTRPTPTDSPNPHLALDEKRFVSESVISFCNFHSDIIKKYRRPDQFITTNGIFRHIDNYRMTQEALDFMSYDSYPNFAFSLSSNPKEKGALNDRWSSKSLSMVRSISENFVVMEQQSNGGGWVNRIEQPAPKPGQMRLWTYQSIANGADFISYFRWRTCTAGTEIYWHGLNDYGNGHNRRLEELKTIAAEVGKLSELAGSRYIADIAIAFDYDNKWDGELDRWHGPLSKASEDAWFEACQLKHIPVNFVCIDEETTFEELLQYKVVIYPHAAILTEKKVKELKKYVENGGILIMGARSGYKDLSGRCYMMDMPGYAGDLFGIRVEDYTLQGPGDDLQFARWGNLLLPAVKFSDVLEAVQPRVNVLAEFTSDYYAGKPALCENRIGRGKAYYFGAGFTRDTAIGFIEKLCLTGPGREIVNAPSEVELIMRRKKEREYLILLNYLPRKVNVEFKQVCFDMLQETKLSGEVEIEPFGVIIARIG